MVISPKVRKILAYFGIGILVILFALLNILIFRFGQDQVRERLTKSLWDRLKKKEVAKVPTPSPTPSPTPTPYPIAQGRQEYNVNLSAKSGPRIGKVTIDPLDAKMKETQSIEVIAKSTSTVSGVLVALRTDKNVLTNHKLTLASGTATDGVWSGSWTNEVIHDYLYQVIITATDAVTSNSTTITIR